MTTYYDALKVSRTATLADIKKAYADLAKTEHPDHGGDAARWSLLSAAFTELKAIANKKRGSWGRNGDLAWARNWDNLNKPVRHEAPKQEAPKDDAPKSDAPKDEQSEGPRDGDRCGHKHRDGQFCGRKFQHSGAHIKEAQYAAHKTYSKEHSKTRYQSDPAYAERLREASKRSHAKKRAAEKAARDAAKDAAAE